MRQGVVVVQELCDAICYNVFSGGDLICIDPHWMLIMMALLRMLTAFPTGDCLAPFWIHASDAALSVKKRVVWFELLFCGAARMAAVMAI